MAFFFFFCHPYHTHQWCYTTFSTPFMVQCTLYKAGGGSQLVHTTGVFFAGVAFFAGAAAALDFGGGAAFFFFAGGSASGPPSEDMTIASLPLSSSVSTAYDFFFAADARAGFWDETGSDSASLPALSESDPDVSSSSSTSFFFTGVFLAGTLPADLLLLVQPVSFRRRENEPRPITQNFVG